MKEMKLNRALIFKVVLVSVLCLGSLGLLSGQEFAGGRGTESDPWQIVTAEHLDNVRNYLGAEHKDKHFIQTAHICLNDFLWDEEADDYINFGRGWIPLGWYVDDNNNSPFAGTYEGAGFIVRGLYIDRPKTNYQGLFGYTEYAFINNLGITNSTIKGASYVGGLAGNTYRSLVSNCYSNASISGVSYIGGLVGSLDSRSHITNSVNGGIISGYKVVGGITGKIYRSHISKNFSNGTIKGKGDFIGGLIGKAYRSTGAYNYNMGSVVAKSRSVGGLVGYSQNSSFGKSYSAGSGGELVGLVFRSSISSSYWDKETSGMENPTNSDARTTEEMTYPYSDNTFVNWDFEKIWKADTDYSINSGYPYLREGPTVSVEHDVVAEIPFCPMLMNYPNPFNPETTIEFLVNKESEATLSVYNIKGQFIKTLHSGIITAGKHSFVWNGRDDSGREVSSGVYLYRLTTGDYQKVEKMLLVK